MLIKSYISEAANRTDAEFDRRWIHSQLSLMIEDTGAELLVCLIRDSLVPIDNILEHIKIS